jgi:hypothetical protein
MSVVELQFEYRLSSALYSSSRTSILLRVSFRNRALGVEKGAAHELKPSPFHFQYTGSVFRSDSDLPTVSQPFRLAYTHFIPQAYLGLPSDSDREPVLDSIFKLPFPYAPYDQHFGSSFGSYPGDLATCTEVVNTFVEVGLISPLGPPFPSEFSSFQPELHPNSALHLHFTISFHLHLSPGGWNLGDSSRSPELRV